MKIVIRPLTSHEGSRWQVCLDQHGVTFACEQQARQFVALLESRLKAPHPLPDERRRNAG